MKSPALYSVFVVVQACNAADGSYLLHILGAIPTWLVGWSIKVIVADGSDTKETGELIRQHYQWYVSSPNSGCIISKEINGVMVASTDEVAVIVHK